MALIERGDITELVISGQFAEGPELEAKEARGSIPRSMWESCSAFANTSGGVIVLGLEQAGDGWVPTGVANPEKMIQDLINQIRDPQKISFAFAGNDDLWAEDVDGATLVVVRVPLASRMSRPVYINNRRELAYLRRGEGDFKCSEAELDQMRLNAGQKSYDQTMYPQIGWDAFDPDSVAQYRRQYEQRKPDLPHHRRDDREFLRLIGAWQKNYETGEEGPTLAGILMLGREEVIRFIRPHHVIDFRRLPIGGLATEGEHFAARERWTGNLLGAWESIFPRLIRHLDLPDRRPEVYRSTQRAGQNTLREAFINMLVHADYRESSDTVIFQRDDGYLFRNPGDSWVNVRELGVQGRSERRNPGIAQLFDNLGLAEQAGSGYATILEEWQKLGYTPPVINSDPGAYEFTLNLALRHLIDPDDRRWLQRLGELWKPEEELALVFVRHDGRIDNATLRTKARIEVLAASQILRSLRDRQFLVLHGSGKNAYYLPGSRLLGDQLPLDLGHDVKSSSGNDRNLPRSGESLTHSDRNLPRNDASSGHNVETLQDELRAHLRTIATPVSQNGRSSPTLVNETILELCATTWLSALELSALLGREPKTIRRYIASLVNEQSLIRMYAKSHHPQQRYRTVSTLESDHT